MVKAFSITDIGKKRQLNQDYVFTSILPLGVLPNLFLVADGMGGHNAGDVASKDTVETIVEEISRMQDQETEPAEVLSVAINRANERIRQLASSDYSMTGMGTTVVAATYADGILTVANVGDSRLYIVNEDIRQVTRDHSLVEEMIRMGGIDRETARTHPDKNIITRAVGAMKYLKIDFFEEALHEGDIVLMCSDGLTNMLEDEDIRRIICERTGLAHKAEELIRIANENGGKDNIAVVLIDPFEQNGK